MDALVLLKMVSEPFQHKEAYRKCMADPDARIRKLAVERLKEFPSSIRAEFMGELKQLISDTSPKVRRAAMDVLKMSDGILKNGQPPE